MKRLINFSVISFLFSATAYAIDMPNDNATLAPSRVIRVIPIDTPSGSAGVVNGGYGGVDQTLFPTIGACSVGFGRKISFVNLSPTPQTIKVKTTNAKMVVQTCDLRYQTNPLLALSGQWGTPNSFPCYPIVINYPAAFPSEVIIQLAAKGDPQGFDRKDSHFNFGCELKRNGFDITRCSYANGPSLPNMIPDLLNNQIIQAVATQDISVMEPEGAVIANLTGGPDSGCVEFENSTKFNIPINGGRAF